MNLGGLTTLARYRPHNLLQIIFDNESLLSVGGFPTATSTGSDLAASAAAAGIPHTATVQAADALSAAVNGAIGRNELASIVAKVDAHYEPPGGTAGFVTDLTLLENRFQFARHLRDVAAGATAAR
jgi:sulfopyruvate decarboxylase subunit beta